MMSMPEFNEGMIEGEQGKGVEPFLLSALEQHKTDAGEQVLPGLLGMMELYGQPAERKYGLKDKGAGWAKTGEEMSKELGSYVKGEGQLSNQTQIAILEAVGVMAEKAGQLKRSPVYHEWNRQREEAMATLTKRWGVEHGYAMSGQEYVPVSQLLGWSKSEQQSVRSEPTKLVDLGRVWKDIKIETATKLTDSLTNVRAIIDFAIKHPREVAVNTVLTATLAACGVANGEGRPTVEIPNGGGETPAAVVSSTMTATAESNGQTITFQEEGFEVGEEMTLTSGMLDLAKMEQMYPDGVEALRTLGKVPEAMNFGQVIVQDANGEDIEYSLAMDPATGEAMVGWIAGAGNEWRTPEAGEAVGEGSWNWVKVSITKGGDGSELVSAFGGRMVLFEVGADGTWKVGLPIIDASTGQQIILEQVMPGGGGGGLFAPKEFFAETLPGEPTEVPTTIPEIDPLEWQKFGPNAEIIATGADLTLWDGTPEEQRFTINPEYAEKLHEGLFTFAAMINWHGNEAIRNQYGNFMQYEQYLKAHPEQVDWTILESNYYAGNPNSRLQAKFVAVSEDVDLSQFAVAFEDADSSPEGEGWIQMLGGIVFKMQIVENESGQKIIKFMISNCRDFAMPENGIVPLGSDYLMEENVITLRQAINFLISRGGRMASGETLDLTGMNDDESLFINFAFDSVDKAFLSAMARGTEYIQPVEQ